MSRLFESPIFAVMTVIGAAVVLVFSGVLGCQREAAPTFEASRVLETLPGDDGAENTRAGDNANGATGSTLEGGRTARATTPADRDPAPIRRIDPRTPAELGGIDEPDYLEPAKPARPEGRTDIADTTTDGEPADDTDDARETDEAAAERPAAPHPGLRIVDGRLARDVKKRTPIEVGDRFVADGQSVWAWVKVKNPGETTHIWMNWRKGNTIYSRVRLEVGKSRGWRTWSRHRMTSERSVGQWVVEVRNDEGKLLDTMAFTVAPNDIAATGDVE